ncbi:MAG: hypothetical protein QXJ76_06630 [Candidatus Bathyarchaeia archaeon]
MDLIIGGGKYGCYAIEHLRQKGKGFVVVDTDPTCLAVKQFGLASSESSTSDGEHFIRGDLSTALKLIEKLKPEYVFPTAPVHIAADLARLKFQLDPWPEAINAILPKLPEVVVLAVGKGKLIASFNRDNGCVEKCSMPKVCPSSNIRKPCTMTELIRFACPDAFILISYSMAPGMGALKGSELLDFFNLAKQRDKFVVATTCDCHGVLDAFQKHI